MQKILRMSIMGFPTVFYIQRPSKDAAKILRDLYLEVGLTLKYFWSYGDFFFPYSSSAKKETYYMHEH